MTKLLLLGAVALLPTGSMLAQTEDDVVINEFVVNPATGKEYVELLVVAPTVDLRGYTLSDVSTRAGATGTTEGDFTLPTDAYLSAVPRGTYVVLEFSTPTANASVLAEDLSLTDATPRTLVIKTTTTGVVLGGVIDNATNDNLQLYAGSRATGVLIDQVLAGTNTSYIAGATFGDNSGTTTADNVNGGTTIPAGSAVRFVPADQTSPAGFQANDTGAAFTVDATSYGTPGTANTGVNDSGGVLPVELVAFTAAADGAGVLLRWTTASETNNAGFSVEARANGAAAWTAVGFEAGRGTTLEASSYAHRVAGLAAGRYSFRLRQTDFDGASSYSAEVEAEIGMAAPVALGVRGQREVRFAVREAQTVRVAVYNALGQRVANLFDGAAEAGAETVVGLEGAALPAGAYFVRLEGARATATRSLVVR